ncbi:DgyrCDS1566 [Dimorphilus gyrociliatus]|uniref:DgyrCDS1566 n=1 Tax=Dimorphilus gyrociliatus TaxID=2664684 RepID=A0A7I8VAK3_9ANNE|nr:DgyrCDS1566 [Dimorphilus gyrociliatus]
MPKGRKKGGKKNNRNGVDSDDEIEGIDNGSVYSNQSDSRSAGTADGFTDDIDETSVQESFEDRLTDFIEMAGQKSAKGRTDCLNAISDAMRKKILLDFLYDRKLTVSDVIEKCLKKGKSAEQCAAAHCSALLAVQLGLNVDTEEMFKTYKPILTTLMLDSSADLRARAACSSALGLWAMIGASENAEEILSVTQSLAKVFKSSFLKGDKTAPTHSPEVTNLHNCALMSWGLLICLLPQQNVQDIVHNNLPRIQELLLSGDLDLRMTAGEIIALVYELASEINQNYQIPSHRILCEELRELSTDSTKSKGKKERRTQRSTFRDVYKYVANGEIPSIKVHFGSEMLLIERWTEKRQYDFLCTLLKSGMNLHLAENEFLRDVFNLGPVIPTGLPKESRESRIQRTLQNQAISKLRTQTRGKNRDKRSAIVHGE